MAHRKIDGTYTKSRKEYEKSYMDAAEQILKVLPDGWYFAGFDPTLSFASNNEERYYDNSVQLPAYVAVAMAEKIKALEAKKELVG